MSDDEEFQCIVLLKLTNIERLIGNLIRASYLLFAVIGVLVLVLA